MKNLGRTVLLGIALGVCLILATHHGGLTIARPNTLVASQPTVIVFDFHTVIGKPSLSAAFVDRVLSAYHSPAIGLGRALYTLSERYDIDDAYALGFFLHESSAGKTGWAAVNRSIGNIRCSWGYTCQGGYRSYSTWQAGAEDWYRLILYGYVQGQVTIPIVGHVCRTVAQIIPVYAPSSDGNDVHAYITAVEHVVDTWRRGEVWV